MWNHHDQEYARLLKLVVNEGRVKKNRTGVDTKGVFGAQARFDLSKGFPLLTTKKVFFKGIVHELLWFLAGDTNIKYLVDNDVHIWDGNCYDQYKKTEGNLFDTRLNHRTDLVPHPEWPIQNGLRWFTKEEFIAKIKNDDDFAARWGELGEGTYGGMWRAFPYADEQWEPQSSANGTYTGHVDQIAKVVDKLRNNPDDRRMLVSAWHPYWVDHCALPPCHVLFHFNTEELTEVERCALWQQKMCKTTLEDGREMVLAGLPNFEGVGFMERFDADGIPRRKLNCLLYQRSCDLFLGVPFNIASYALLTHMMAHVTNMVPGEFIHTYGDLHIYENHFKQVYQQLGNGSFEAPTLRLNPLVRNIDEFKFSDIELQNYVSQPTIKAEMAV